MGTPSTSAVTFRAHIVPSAVLQHAAGNDNPLKCSLSRADACLGSIEIQTKKGTCGCRCLFAPENNEILNLWRDFLKVVDFIDDNHEWLNPLLAQTDKMKQ